MDRERQAKWDGENMATVSTKLRRREYMKLRALCVAYHTTPYAVLQHLVTAWMMAAEQTDRALARLLPKGSVALLFIVGAGYHGPQGLRPGANGERRQGLPTAVGALRP